MNQKYLRYTLITAVLAVWGIIGYKVLAALAKDDVASGNSSVKLNVPLIELRKDTFSLLAHYTDPFLPVSMEDDSIEMDSVKSEIVNPGVIATAEPPIDISFIQYLGMITNVEKKSRAAVISIRGREVIVREKDFINDIIIKSISAGKIAIVYKKKNFNITRSL